MRWCLDWLERLEQSDEVVVNLRPYTEDETEFVPFDSPRVLQVLARITADLDEFARSPLPTAESTAAGNELEKKDCHKNGRKIEVQRYEQS